MVYISSDYQPAFSGSDDSDISEVSGSDYDWTTFFGSDYNRIRYN